MWLSDKLLNICKTQYNKLPEDSKKIITVLNKPKMLSINSIEDGLPPMPALEGDEEQEETIAGRIKLNLWKRTRRQETRTGLEILTANKLLTRLPIILAQKKATKNSCTLKQ